MRFKELKYWSGWHDTYETAKATVKCSHCGCLYDQREGGCGCPKGKGK